MARPGPQTQAKRRREQEKKDKRRAKDEKKALKKAIKNGEIEPTDDSLEAEAEQQSPPVPLQVKANVLKS